MVGNGKNIAVKNVQGIQKKIERKIFAMPRQDSNWQ